MAPIKASSGHFKVGPLDLMRVDSMIIAALGPVRVPDAAVLSERLVQIGRAGPHTRVGLRPSSRSQTWDHDPDALGSAVHVLAPADETELPEVVTEIAQRRPRGIELYIAGDFLLVAMSHGLGDGRFPVLLLRELLLDPDQSSVGPPALTSRDPGRGVLSASIASWFGRHPGRIAQLARLLRAERPSIGPGSPVSDEAYRPTLRFARMPAEAVTELTDWRKEFAPNATAATAVFTLLARSLDAAGIAISETSHILSDGRRYNDRAGAFNGNFAVGLDFDFPQPYDPEALALRIRRALKAGRPLAAMGLGAVRSQMHRGEHDGVAASRQPKPVVSFSDIGRASPIETVEWATPTPGHCLMGMTDPYGHNGIAFILVQVGLELSVSVTFNSAVHDADLMQSVVSAVCVCPLTFVTGGIR